MSATWPNHRFYTGNPDCFVVAAFVSTPSNPTRDGWRNPRRPFFNATDVYKAAHNIRGSAHELRADLLVSERASRDTAETMSILPLRRTNASPKYHRSRESLAARKASTR